MKRAIIFLSMCFLVFNGYAQTKKQKTETVKDTSAKQVDTTKYFQLVLPQQAMEQLIYFVSRSKALSEDALPQYIDIIKQNIKQVQVKKQ